MKPLKPLFILLLLLVNSSLLFAQGTKSDDLMRSSGRIYVVIAVMLTILAGLIIYLVRLDRKISKLEKE
jgi:hypothetical protein